MDTFTLNVYMTLIIIKHTEMVLLYAMAQTSSFIKNYKQVLHKNQFTPIFTLQPHWPHTRLCPTPGNNTP